MGIRLACVLLLLALSARAVIVRGNVTSPLGAPVAGARVQLILLSGGSRNVADTISGIDGSYEIRSSLGGQFLLLTTSRAFAPQIGYAFYAGRTDLVTRNLALDLLTITPQLTNQTTLTETPLAQLSTATHQVPPDRLLTEATIVHALEPISGSFLVQFGQTGAPASLYLRGASPESTKTVVDGVSAEDLGGGFNFGDVSASALGALATSPAIELTAGANPLYLLDATGGVVTLHTPRATTLRPALTYSGDAGSLASLRDEAVATATLTRADALLSFARFDTGNVREPFHVATSAANLGYQISANTGLRFTLRNEVSAGVLPSAIELFGVAPEGRLGAQNLYSSFSIETRSAREWHNLLRFGVARKRSETFDFFTPQSGVRTTIVGANGFSATGAATFFALPVREDLVSNRDEYTYQSDAPLRSYLKVLLTVRYQRERAADLRPELRTRLGRDHIAAAGGLEGTIRDRFFYAASGFFDHSALLGFTGAPRLGLTYVPVRPGSRWLRGTSLHATAATGVREPGLLEQALFEQAGSGRIFAPRSRTFDLSVDQNLLAQRLLLRFAYFHNQFAHQSEVLVAPEVPILSQTLAFRTQGVELDLRYQPYPRLSLEAGYTFLAALVEQSAAAPSFNPNLPGIPIGALTALPGARPFHRPPHTGFFAAEYTGNRLAAAFKGALASRSDDSTNLFQNPTLLLPNRGLSPGYVSLDANVSLAFGRHITAYTQLTNLADSRHIAPIGYLSTPFVIRAGLRLRVGGE